MRHTLNTVRDKQIVRLVESKTMTLEVIGHKYGIGSERVRQIAEAHNVTPAHRHWKHKQVMQSYWPRRCRSIVRQAKRKRAQRVMLIDKLCSLAEFLERTPTTYELGEYCGGPVQGLARAFGWDKTPHRIRMARWYRLAGMQVRKVGSQGHV